MNNRYYPIIIIVIIIIQFIPTCSLCLPSKSSKLTNKMNIQDTFSPSFPRQSCIYSRCQRAELRMIFLSMSISLSQVQPFEQVPTNEM